MHFSFNIFVDHFFFILFRRFWSHEICIHRSTLIGQPASIDSKWIVCVCGTRWILAHRSCIAFVIAHRLETTASMIIVFFSTFWFISPINLRLKRRKGDCKQHKQQVRHRWLSKYYAKTIRTWCMGEMINRQAIIAAAANDATTTSLSYVLSNDVENRIDKSRRKKIEIEL